MWEVKLAILIPTLTERVKLKERLITTLKKQINKLPNPDGVVIFCNEDNGEKKIGEKRNELIANAKEVKAISIANFDDDDLPGENYIARQLEGIDAGFDCCSLWGQIYFHGIAGKPFHHSIIHKEWWEDQKFYYRMPNHLNAIRLDKVKDIPYHPQNFGEDGRWSNEVRDAGVLKTEYQINETIYHYFTGKKGSAIETEVFNKLMSL